MMKPATTAVKIPACGLAPRGDGEGHGQRQGDDADGDSRDQGPNGNRSASKSWKGGESSFGRNPATTAHNRQRLASNCRSTSIESSRWR